MKITTRERLLLIGLVIFVFIWLAFDYGITPIKEEVSILQQEKKLLNLELQEYRLLYTNESQYDQIIKKSYEKIEEAAVNYFNTTPQDEMILLFNDFLATPFFNEEQIDFSGQTSINVNGVPFAKETITIQFGSQYISALNLFKTIWSFPKEIQVARLDLEGAGYDELSGQVVFETYQFLMDTSVVDGLYQWYTDDMLYKDNPFKLYEPSDDIVRYLYLKNDDIFNYSKYFEFTDIEGHYLQEEIEEFLDLGYLYLNPFLAFGPDEAITRGEFIVLLDRVYQWPLVDTDTDLTTFRDYEDLGSLESAFAKAIHKGFLSGYIEGYDDNTLRPRDPVTYKEVEILMNRIQERNDFHWENVTDKLVKMSGEYKSEWTTDSGYLTKAEAIFLLYYYK